MRRAALIAFVLFLPLLAWAAGPCSTTGTGSALKKAADGLGARDWCVFAATAGSVAAAYTLPNGEGFESCNGQSSQHGIITDLDNLGWWPGTVTGQGHIAFSGSPHGGETIAAFYNEATNTWSSKSTRLACGGSGCANAHLSTPGKYPTGSSCCNAHGYDTNAVDPATGDLYSLRGNPSSRTMERWGWEDDTWNTEPTPPETFSGSGGDRAMVYFPSFSGGGVNGAFVFSTGNGNWHAFDPDTDTYTTSFGGLTCQYSGERMMEYNPVHDIAFHMCGSTGSNSPQSYKIEPDGTVTAYPSDSIRYAPGGAAVAAEAVDGNFIIYSCRDGATWWEFDPTGSGSYNQIAHSMPSPVESSNCRDSPASVAIPEYNVILYVQSNRSTTPNSHWIFLYRHATHTPSDDNPPPPPENVEAQ